MPSSRCFYLKRPRNRTHYRNIKGTMFYQLSYRGQAPMFLQAGDSCRVHPPVPSCCCVVPCRPDPGPASCSPAPPPGSPSAYWTGPGTATAQRIWHPRIWHHKIWFHIKTTVSCTVCGSCRRTTDACSVCLFPLTFSFSRSIIFCVRAASVLSICFNHYGERENEFHSR